MSEKLIIKNFGPIDEMDLEIKKTTIFIGPTASGKSTVAKLLAIFRSLDVVVDDKDFLECFQDFLIANYFNGKETYIEYSNSDYKIIYKKEKWSKEKTPEFKKEIEIEKTRINDFFSGILKERYKDLPDKEQKQIFTQMYDANWKSFFRIKKQQIYIPAERILSALISGQGFSFNDVALPGSLKQFGKHFERTKYGLSELEIASLGITVKYEDEGNSKGMRVYYDGKNSVAFHETSSGIQSSVPVYLVMEYLLRLGTGYSFIVEEPELNLFPTAQRDFLYFLVEKCNHLHELVITTHSPYILSVLNNLLFAHIVGDLSEEMKNNVKGIIKDDLWINPEKFAAYYFKKGKARSIIDPNTKLISDNELDNLSQDISGERDTLFELYS